MKFLTPEEISYINNVIINPDLKTESTMKCIQWRNEIAKKIYQKSITPEEEMQYDRIRDFENITLLLKGDIPSTMEEFTLILDTLDEKEKNFIARAMIENTFEEIHNQVDLDHLKSVFQNEYEADLDEPFIQDMINNIYQNHTLQYTYENIYQIILNSQFKHIDDNILFQFYFLLFKSLKTENRYQGLKGIDPKLVLYLLLKSSVKVYGFGGNSQRIG